MGFLSNLMGWRNKTPLLGEAERQAVERAVAAVEPLLKTVSGYRRRLAPAVRHAMAYCEALVATVPGPIEVNSHAYAADPLIHALFATSGDIAATLGKSRAVKQFLADPAGALADDFYALLGMRLHEKKVLGMAMQGDVICNDMPQRLLYFSDHTLGELSHDLDDTRRRLRQASFDSLATSFAAQLAELRHERQELHNQWDMQRALQRSAAAIDHSHAQRCAALEEQLRLAAEALSPERILAALVAWLKAPELHLHLDPTTISVDRMGVILDDATGNSEASTLSFLELFGRDRRHWIVLLARIPREEATRGIRVQQEASRYLII